jgi:GNAT superfamily N-acetyltransferase
MVDIIRAMPGEAAFLKDIAIASKGYWGYPEELISKWAQTTIITPEAIANDLVFKACVDLDVAGWYRFIPQSLMATLEDLWILPAYMGQGIGRRLFEHAVEQARSNGAVEFELDADPHAVPFYQKMGCKVIGESLSEWGRKIPRMRYGP